MFDDANDFINLPRGAKWRLLNVKALRNIVGSLILPVMSDQLLFLKECRGDLFDIKSLKFKKDAVPTKGCDYRSHGYQFKYFDKSSSILAYAAKHD